MFELLRVTPDLVRMKQHEIEDKVIYDYIRKTQSDYTDIYENTYSLIRQGVTTLEEAGRVLDSNILKVYNINRKSGLT
ncbi:MAG: hypothetical protein SPL59_07680 [Catonella sp.]|nr:hypothetical protein [Catonella sp.]